MPEPPPTQHRISTMYKITATERLDNPYMNYMELEYSFEQLARFLTIPRKGKKKHLPAFSPAIFSGRLDSESVISISCMVFDIDDGVQFEDHNVFKDFQYIAYTSPSHTLLNHKWRLVIPLDTPIPKEYWEYVWDDMIAWGSKKLNIGMSFDKTCKDPRRFYYLGRSTRDFEYHVNSSGLLYWVNIDEIMERKARREAAQKKALEEQQQRLKQMANKPARNRDIYQELRMNLGVNKQYRMVLANRIGARITSGSNPRAVGWDCPLCNRNDCTFFYLDPISNKLGAFCNHQNSCGMSMSLFELGRIKGVF